MSSAAPAASFSRVTYICPSLAAAFECGMPDPPICHAHSASTPPPPFPLPPHPLEIHEVPLHPRLRNRRPQILLRPTHLRPMMLPLRRRVPAEAARQPAVRSAVRVQHQ